MSKFLLVFSPHGFIYEKGIYLFKRFFRNTCFMGAIIAFVIFVFKRLWSTKLIGIQPTDMEKIDNLFITSLGLSTMWGVYLLITLIGIILSIIISAIAMKYHQNILRYRWLVYLSILIIGIGLTTLSIKYHFYQTTTVVVLPIITLITEIDFPIIVNEIKEIDTG